VEAMLWHCPFNISLCLEVARHIPFRIITNLKAHMSFSRGVPDEVTSMATINSCSKGDCKEKKQIVLCFSV
jgi:hypothetical protein